MGLRLNITAGNDKRVVLWLLNGLRDESREPFPVELSEDVAVKMVSEVGTRHAVSFVVGDEGRVLLDLKGSDYKIGLWGIEVVGRLNGAKWRAYGDSMIHYTATTERGAEQVTVQADDDELTLVVGYAKGFVPMRTSELTNDGDGQSPFATEKQVAEDVGALQQQVAGKQDTIQDLAEIRSGAAAGALAVQVENDPTVPAWAKQPSKPTYTAQEVGALPADTPLFSGSYNDLSDKPTIPTVASASDFDNPDATKRAKVPTVGAILDYIDPEPTAGSEKPVQSGGIWNETSKLGGEVNLLSIPKSKYSINKYNDFYNSTRSSIIIPINRVISKIRIQTDSYQGTQIAFLKTKCVVGQVADYSSGTGLIEISENNDFTYAIPSDANYLYMLASTSDGTSLLEHITLTLQGIIHDISELSDKVGVLSGKLNPTIQTIENPGGGTKRNIYITTNGIVEEGYTSASVNVDDFTNVSIKNTGVNTTYFYTFLTEDITLGSSVSFADGYSGLKRISLNQTAEVVVPSNAKYLYLSKNTAIYPDVVLKRDSELNEVKKDVEALQGEQSAISKINCPLAETISGIGTAASPYTSEDGTAGIRASINKKVLGGKLMIPSGVYNVTSQIVIPYRNINIEGDVWNYPQDPNGVHPSNTGTKLNLITNGIESVFKTQSNMSGMRMAQIGFQGLATTWDYENADGNIADYYFDPNNIKNVGLYIGSGRFDQVCLHRLSFCGFAVGILAKYTIDANVWSEINTDGCDFGIYVDYAYCHHPKILNNIVSDCCAAGIFYKTRIDQNSYGAVIDGNVLVRNGSYLTQVQIAAGIPQASLVLIGHAYASVSNNTIILSGVYKRKAGGTNYTAYEGGIGLYFTGNHNVIRGNKIAWSTSKAAYISGNYNSIANNTIEDEHSGVEIVGNYNSVTGNVFDSVLSVSGNNNIIENNVHTGVVTISGDNNVFEGTLSTVVVVSGNNNILIGVAEVNVTNNGTGTVIK